MHIIKLNAIDSTNLYLKKLAEKKQLENYTVAVARHQTAGRGQMGTRWVSEKNKNLTFSMLIQFDALKIEEQFYCSMAVSVAVLEVLKKNVKNSLSIKWPNDILADDYKVVGILIENILKGDTIKQSVVGIGINVNQEIFPSNIGKVSSLKLLTGTTFDTDALLVDLIQSLTFYMQLVTQKQFDELREVYYSNLLKFNKPAMFEDTHGNQFLGKICAVNKDGRLVIELEDETTRKFSLKEIKFASK